jgi:DNA-binding HxlR family transcriptional regulator
MPAYDGEVCSAARALEIAGERWSLLILRNAIFAGMTRFGELERSLGIAPNVLSARLAMFVTEGLMTAGPGPDGIAAYHLTEKGWDFAPVLVALTAWGDRWAAPDGPPIRFEHAGCGGAVVGPLTCDRCGAATPPPEVLAKKTAAMARARARRGLPAR